MPGVVAGGVFAVLGNHDWWLDGARVRDAFESAGIRVLDLIDAEPERVARVQSNSRLFRQAMTEAGLPVLPATTVTSVEEGLAALETIGLQMSNNSYGKYLLQIVAEEVSSR